MSNSEHSKQFQDNYCIIFCTCPDVASSEKIAGELVEKHLAACVNLIPNITSVYQWQGNLEKSQEFLLVIKTRSKMFESVEKAILGLHPYELPEIISIPLQEGFSNYLSWIDDNIDEDATPVS